MSSTRRWLLEIFDRKRGVCNPGTAARGPFGDLGLLGAHTCPRPAEHNRAPCGHGMYKDPKHRNGPVPRCAIAIVAVLVLAGWQQ